jgi:O-acetyl-ADP-ribose deacetylase (regulator of RNase III)
VSSAQTAAIPSRAFSNSLSSQMPFGPRDAARRRAVSTCSLEFTIGDITRQSVDAIVNPTGPGLVDLAVRRSAGPALLDAFHGALAELADQRLSPGQAVVTAGFGLPAPHVIHVAPPIYADDPAAAREQLVACHVEALRLARAHGFASIAFPAIATGIYRYPADEAAEVAVGAVVAALRAQPGPRTVRFVLSGPAMLARYAAVAA